MRLKAFALRVFKEIIRDPLTLIFGIGFPLVLLLLLSAIQANIPVSLFEIESLTPGIAVFGLSFMTLFSAMVVSRDRSGAFLQRLYTTPIKPAEFILGYTLPMVPVAVLQTVICYIAAAVLGLEINGSVLLAVIANIPAAVLYISMGLLFGSILNDKQVGGVCGALLTNLSAWLSGTWFDLNLVGGVFKKIADVLPFSHAVELGRAVLNSGDAAPHLLWVAGYALVLLVLSVVFFVRQMKE